MTTDHELALVAKRIERAFVDGGLDAVRKVTIAPEIQLKVLNDPSFRLRLVVAIADHTKLSPDDQAMIALEGI